MKRWLFAAVIAGCASASTLPSVRFANAPPADVVNDRGDVPRPPAVRPFLGPYYHFNGSFYRRLIRPLEVPRPERARGVNAIDEVPDSTWFTNRIGHHDLTPQQIHDGPREVGSPEPHKPWTIISTKTGGANIGFRFKDARGHAYLMKFDFEGHPEVETATAVIVNRLLWAAGYNVPEDDVVYFRTDELRVAPDATYTDRLERTLPLDSIVVEQNLAQVQRNHDGSIRALVSRIVNGKALGGHPERGTRADDPNDRIPHELRRDLRGLYALFAWLDHVDIKESNTLDVWTADRADPRRHYVEHYLIDFGGALGSMARVRHDKRRGHQYAFDLAKMIETTATLGLKERSWEGRTAPPLPGVGLFEASHYRPGEWVPYTSAYLPLQLADRIDKLWGAKIVMRFTPAQIRAAVAAARFTTPAAADYVVKTLIARQRATAQHWFAQTSPLDRFVVVPDGDEHALCFEDLALTYGLTSEPTRYTVARRDRSGRSFAPTLMLDATMTGRACMPVRLASDADGYTILELAVRRGSTTLVTTVHLALAPITHAPRVVGVWRM